MVYMARSQLVNGRTYPCLPSSSRLRLMRQCSYPRASSASETTDVHLAKMPWTSVYMEKCCQCRAGFQQAHSRNGGCQPQGQSVPVAVVGPAGAK